LAVELVQCAGARRRCGDGASGDAKVRRVSLGSWEISYLLIGEGVLRELMASRVPVDLLTASPSLGLTIFSWDH
jgi:hypothetical protein